MAILKLEPFSGVSGDMFLGALAGLAEAHDELIHLPSLLGLEDEVVIEISDVVKCGIACRHVNVTDRHRPLPAKSPPHPPHDDAQDHDHTHAQGHERAHSPHEHRHLADILKLIANRPLTDNAKRIASGIFQLLGEAEAAVHGIDIENIHFHEVGAWDSITDIVGSAMLLDRLGIEKTYCTPVSTGYGFANVDHGRLPVPCPATQRLLLGMPTTRGEVARELTTPTGAAILRFLQPDFDLPVLIEECVACGPGTLDFHLPNVLRASLCRPSTQPARLLQIQSNIDDLSGEHLGQPFQEGLLKAGAIDFYLDQVIMKKGRPGIVLNVICPPADLPRVSDFILDQTSTIGLRYFGIDRIECEREDREIELFGRTLPIKHSVRPSGKNHYKADHDTLQAIAAEQGLSPLEVERALARQLGNA